jgi:hypothetical protein
MATIPPETGYSSLSESGVVEIPAPPSRQIPEHTSEAHWRRPPMETALEHYAVAVGRTLGLLSRTSAQLYDIMRVYTQEKYSEVEHETKNLSRRTQENASYVRERYPLEALGAIAATAFVAGVALRVWRSRAS